MQFVLTKNKLINGLKTSKTFTLYFAVEGTLLVKVNPFEMTAQLVNFITLFWGLTLNMDCSRIKREKNSQYENIAKRKWIVGIIH
jgi:hypothetical protein